MRYYYLLVLFLSSSIWASAQITIEPLQSNPVLQQATALSAAAADQPEAKERSVVHQTLSLPFFDDFAYPGPYPNPDLWIDSNAYVNDHLAFRPLSVGAATFDGLDSKGLPYGGGFGPSDYLTSQAIDLEGSTPADNIFINFYIQRKGVSNFFPTLNDSLVLQFLDTASQWITIDTFMGLKNSTSPLDTFLFSEKLSYPINSPAYFHNAFQFRFVNHCNRLGLQYLWHLDYVYIDVKSPSADLVDLAFVARPPGVLNLYNHMPWNQFRRGDLRSDWEFQLFNHDIINSQLGARMNRLNIRQGTNPNPIFETTLFNDDQLNVASRSYSFVSGNRSIDGLFDELDPVTGPFSLQSEFIFTTTANEEQGIPSTEDNNATQRVNVFGDFFAYDDGTTEGVVASRSLGNQIAVEFNLVEADILRGVSINFPFSGSAQSGDFEVKVWSGSPGDDNLALLYTSPKKEVVNAQDFFDTLNAFTTYPLVDDEGELVELNLPIGKFTIGIEHVSTNNTFIGLGYDLNSTQAQPFQWFKPPSNQSPWFNIDQPGALMIRPIFGDIPPVMTQTEEVSRPFETNELRLFPNPAQNYLQLRGFDWSRGDWQVSIFNAAGQLLLQQAADPEIEVSQLPDGIYILQLHNLDLGIQAKEKFLILR